MIEMEVNFPIIEVLGSSLVILWITSTGSQPAEFFLLSLGRDANLTLLCPVPQGYLMSGFTPISPQLWICIGNNHIDGRTVRLICKFYTCATLEVKTDGFYGLGFM